MNIGEHFHALTVKGVDQLLSEEEQGDWLTYYLLLADDPKQLRPAGHEVAGVTLFQWIDFCMLNIEPIRQLRDRGGEVVLGIQR